MIQSDTKRADDVVRVRLEALIPAKKSRKKILISFILFLLASERPIMMLKLFSKLFLEIRAEKY